MNLPLKGISTRISELNFKLNSALMHDLIPPFPSPFRLPWADIRRGRVAKKPHGQAQFSGKSYVVFGQHAVLGHAHFVRLVLVLGDA
ncbi:Uncharacterized protein APZ42_003399, partial [Daphnia magna]